MIPLALLDAWLARLAPETASRALLGAGISYGDLGAARAAVRPHSGPVRWSLTEEHFAHIAQRDPRMIVVEPGVDIRLAIESHAQPEEIVRRLLGVPRIESAFVALERSETLLRPRPWQWPLRIGLVGLAPDMEALVRRRVEHTSLARLLEMRVLDEEPGAVDVLLIGGPLVSAVAEIFRTRPIANAIVVIDEHAGQLATSPGLMAAARAATGAVASAVIAPRDVPDLLGELIAEASHGAPFDVALTRATRGKLLLWAEPDAMLASDVPAIALHSAVELGRARQTMAEPPARLETLREQLIATAGDPFLAEAHDATAAADISDASARSSGTRRMTGGVRYASDPTA